MRIAEINAMDTCVDEIPCGASGVHESVLRAYQILEKVKDLIGRGVPPAVVLDLIDEMEYRAE